LPTITTKYNNKSLKAWKPQEYAVRFTRFALPSGLIYDSYVESHIKTRNKGSTGTVFPCFPCFPWLSFLDWVFPCLLWYRALVS